MNKNHYIKYCEPPSPLVLPPVLAEAIQTTQSAIASLPMIEAAAFDPRISPDGRFLLLEAVIGACHFTRQLDRRLAAAKALYALKKTADTCHHLSIAYSYLNRLEEALLYIKEACEFPESNIPVYDDKFQLRYVCSEIQNYMSHILLRLGRWDEEFERQRNDGILKGQLYNGENLVRRPWCGQPTDEPIAVAIEGGYGDAFFWARLLPLVQEIAPRAFLYLLPVENKPGKLFSDEMCQFFRRQSLDVRRKFDPDALMLNCVYLPNVLRLTCEGDWSDRIPLFHADAALTDQFSYLRSDKPLVGLCHKAEAMESTSLGNLTEGHYRHLSEEQVNRILTSTPNINWVNLQFGETRPSLQHPNLEGWEKTAAVIANLDAVVSVDTVTAHLSAAMGKPTNILLGGLVDWRYGNRRDRCPFYSSSKHYRSDGPGFDRAVDDLVRDLKKMEKRAL